MSKHKKILDKYKDDYNENKSIEDSQITISFKDTCEKNCLLHNWCKAEDLKKLNSCLKIISSLNWTSIATHKDLAFKYIPQESLKKTLPHQISKDESIFELRVGYDSARRLFAYRNKNILHIIWFDLNHEVLPYHKNLK